MDAEPEINFHCVDGLMPEGQAKKRIEFFQSIFELRYLRNFG